AIERCEQLRIVRLQARIAGPVVIRQRAKALAPDHLRQQQAAVDAEHAVLQPADGFGKFEKGLMVVVFRAEGNLRDSSGEAVKIGLHRGEHGRLGIAREIQAVDAMAVGAIAGHTESGVFERRGAVVAERYGSGYERSVVIVDGKIPEAVGALSQNL